MFASKSLPNKEEKKQAVSNKIYIIFDIDEVLATILTENQEEGSFFDWFNTRNLIINAILPHIIHPGVVELMQYLFDLPNVNVRFFSAGMKIRNELFVEKLLIRALGKEKCDAIKIDELIASRDDLEKYDWGYRKNIRKVIQSKEDLGRAILIDDKSRNIKKSQIVNG